MYSALTLRAVLLCTTLSSLAIAAEGIYSIADPCFPAQCSATVLNNRGEIAGQSFNRTDRRGFEVTLNGGFTAPLIADTNSYVLPRGINTAGLLAVEYGTYNGPASAGIYNPLSGALLNLNTAFAWTGASRATWINDFNEIAAHSDFSDLGKNPQARGWPLAIANNRAFVTTLTPGNSEQNATWIVINPDGTGRVTLTGAVIAVSTSGHVLELVHFVVPKYYVFVPGTGEKVVSVSDAQPFALNDADQLLVHTVDGDALWDGTGRPRLLQDLIPADSTWKIVRGRAINNSGQILVDANNGSRVSSLLLSPPTN